MLTSMYGNSQFTSYKVSHHSNSVAVYMLCGMYLMEGKILRKAKSNTDTGAQGPIQFTFFCA